MWISLEILGYPVKERCFLLGSSLKSGSFVCFSVDLCLDPQGNALKSMDFTKIHRFRPCRFQWDSDLEICGLYT